MLRIPTTATRPEQRLGQRVRQPRGRAAPVLPDIGEDALELAGAQQRVERPLPASLVQRPARRPRPAEPRERPGEPREQRSPLERAAPIAEDVNIEGLFLCHLDLVLPTSSIR